MLLLLLKKRKRSLRHSNKAKNIMDSIVWYIITAIPSYAYAFIGLPALVALYYSMLIFDIKAKDIYKKIQRIYEYLKGLLTKTNGYTLFFWGLFIGNIYWTYIIVSKILVVHEALRNLEDTQTIEMD
jgi:hypothetical protein